MELGWGHVIGMELGWGHVIYWIGMGLSWISVLGCLAMLVTRWHRLRRRTRVLRVSALSLYSVVLLASPVVLWLGAEHALQIFGASQMAPMIVNGSGWAMGLLMTGAGVAMLLLSAVHVGNEGECS